jgi:general transcription factor IIIA
MLRCPYPDVDKLTDMWVNEILTGQRCQYAFRRAYDLRRHLKAVHDIDSGKERVEEWVKSRKAAHH